MDEAEQERIAQAIRAFIVRQRMSRATFAQKAKLGKSTVDKLLIGRFSAKTLMQVEGLLGVRFSIGSHVTGKVAADELGRYTSDDVAKYPGCYVLVRPSFTADSELTAFAVEIEWRDSIPGLVVVETVLGEAALPAQVGTLYIPRASNHLFILSNEGGWLKSAILTQLDVERKMRGAMLTMGHVFGNTYMPVSAPVVLVKCDRIEASMVGRLTSADPPYQQYLAELRKVETGNYARWVSYGR